MAADDDDAFGPLFRKLQRLAQIDEADRQAIRDLPFIVRDVRPGEYLVREGERPTSCCVMLAGYACRHKTTGGGGRQIVSFHVPGDILDLQHLLLPHADHNLQAITAGTYACLPIADLRKIAVERTTIGAALWRDTLIDASIFREWVLNVGRRDAKARIAHMICEFATRRAAAGLGGPEQLALPLTQEQIADATGLTAVHVNRMLAVLGAEGLVSRDRRPAQIIDWQGLRRAAGFDPHYLHAAA